MDKKSFWNTEIPVGYYDILHNQEEKKAKLQSNWHFLTYSRVSEKLINDLIHLDYACGSGTLIGQFSNSTSLGYDISENQINYANLKYSNENKNFTFEESEINNKSPYDIITILGLFEYLTDNEILDLLKNMKQLIKKTGKIIITTPNYKSSIHILEIISNLISPVNYANVNINKLNISKLIKLIDKSEYEIVQVNKFLNFGILFSIFNKNFGLKLESKINSIFNGKFGYLLYLELTPKFLN